MLDFSSRTRSDRFLSERIQDEKLRYTPDVSNELSENK